MYNPPDPSSLPTQTSTSPTYTYVMHILPTQMKGNVSPFRDGQLTITSDGVSIQGKAVLPAGQRLLVILAGAILGLVIGALIAILLLDQAIRSYRTLSLRWGQIGKVLLAPNEQRACLLYTVPGKPGQIEFLAFALDPYAFAHFVQVVQFFAPAKVHTAEIAQAKPASAWVLLLIVILCLIAVPFIFIVLSGPGR